MTGPKKQPIIVQSIKDARSLIAVCKILRQQGIRDVFLPDYALYQKIREEMMAAGASPLHVHGVWVGWYSHTGTRTTRNSEMP